MSSARGLPMDPLAADDIALVRADNPGPFTLEGTNTWLVGRDPCWVVDPGPALDAHVERVAAAAAERGGLGGIALTHGHADHSGGVAACWRPRGDVPVAAAAWEGATMRLADGDAPVRCGDRDPGHSPDHLAFRAGPRAVQRRRRARARERLRRPRSRRAERLPAALRRLLRADADADLPGHGPLVTEPRAKLEQYLAHRLDRERRLREALDDGPARAPTSCSTASGRTRRRSCAAPPPSRSPRTSTSSPRRARCRPGWNARARLYRERDDRRTANRTPATGDRGGAEPLRKRSMSVEQKVTVCRICEAHCGMVATVEDGVVTKLRPDKDHPLSAGEACPKGIAMTDVQNDPDRVIHPLRRTGRREFERSRWETAIAEIGARLRAVIAANGPQSVGWYFGNPGAFSYSHTLWAQGLLDALGTPHYYTAPRRTSPTASWRARCSTARRRCSRSPTSSARASC